MDDSAGFCSGCGVRIDKNAGAFGGGGENASPGSLVGYEQPQQQTFNSGGVNPYDRGGFGWFLLGFLTGGIIAIVLYFVFRREYPKRAKSILTGCITIWVIGLILIIAGAAGWLGDGNARTIVNLWN